MGKKLTIYLNDELTGKLNTEENVSGLISSLLDRHYSDKYEDLITKKEELEDQVSVIDHKLKTYSKDKKLTEKATEELQEIKNEQQETIDLIEKWNFAYNDNKITDEYYWGSYDKGKHVFDIVRVKNKLKELGKL